MIWFIYIFCNKCKINRLILKILKLPKRRDVLQKLPTRSVRFLKAKVPKLPLKQDSSNNNNTQRRRKLDPKAILLPILFRMSLEGESKSFLFQSLEAKTGGISIDSLRRCLLILVPRLQVVKNGRKGLLRWQRSIANKI